MKREIIFEETVKYQHRIIVEYNNEEELDEALDHTEGCHNLDECIEAIEKILPIDVVDENYSEDVDGIEYYDDYPARMN